MVGSEVGFGTSSRAGGSRTGAGVKNTQENCEESEKGWPKTARWSTKVCRIVYYIIMLSNDTNTNILRYIINSPEYEEILEERLINEGTKKGKKTPKLQAKNTSSKKNAN